MEKEFKNPFSKIRAEQMGDSAWKYFVVPSKAHIGSKPLIFEGSRGTGKTMFLKCNSWKEKYNEAIASKHDFKNFILNNQHIGFYYLTDGRFVKSLQKKNVNDEIWIGIFNTYFNVVLAKEIIEFIELLINDKIILFSDIQYALDKVSLRIKKPKPLSLNEIIQSLDETLIAIEHFSNNTNEAQPIGLNSGTIIEDILLQLKKNPLFTETTFHIFIDEYEKLTASQQIELNTLLKQSNSNIVYDFGVLSKGILTPKTSTGQEIRRKDDFSLFSTDRYDYYEKNEYNEFLKEICKKRLQVELDRSEIEFDERNYDITFYLKYYGKQHEIALFSKSPKLSKIKDRIYEEIKRHCSLYGYTEDEQIVIRKELLNCSPIHMRMHLALLLRKNKDKIPALDLVEHKISNSAKYQDWCHNTETAVFYLLCDELNIEKTYHGFNAFSALSSGVIRSFLELAEFAFDFAMNSNNPFSIDNLREFTIDEQTKAVNFVSNFKIKEIDSYEPYGYRLKEFTIALGKIFNALQTNPNATLGEVEQNHFTTNTAELRFNFPNADLLLKDSVRNMILEEDNPTKTKSEDSVEFLDYHLNHIYCPAFKISYLRKRKINLNYKDLAKLINGTHKELTDTVKKLSGIKDLDEPNLFDEI